MEAANLPTSQKFENAGSPCIKWCLATGRGFLFWPNIRIGAKYCFPEVLRNFCRTIMWLFYYAAVLMNGPYNGSCSSVRSLRAFLNSKKTSTENPNWNGAGVICVPIYTDSRIICPHSRPMWFPGPIFVIYGLRGTILRLELHATASWYVAERAGEAFAFPLNFSLPEFAFKHRPTTF